MSCDADFQALERLVQQLYFKHRNKVVRLVLNRMSTVYVPGKCPVDVAQDAWIAFSKRLCKNNYERTFLKKGETPAEREIRLCKLLIRITGLEIFNHYRKRNRKGVRGQINVDFNSEYGKGLLEACLTSQGVNSIDSASVEEAVEDLLRWAACQDKEVWRTAGAIVGVVKDNEFATMPTDEELAAEVSRRRGKYITIHQIRYARELLLAKAQSMPELKHFFRHKL